MILAQLSAEFVCERMVDSIPKPVSSRYSFRDVILFESSARRSLGQLLLDVTRKATDECS